MAAQAALIKNLFAFPVRQSGGHSRRDYGMISKVPGKIIYQFVFGIGGYFGAPADHLVDLANPFVPRQPLLKDWLGAVTNQASIGSDIPAVSIGQFAVLGSAKSNVRSKARDGDAGYNDRDDSHTTHFYGPRHYPWDVRGLTISGVTWPGVRSTPAFVHCLVSFDYGVTVTRTVSTTF